MSHLIVDRENWSPGRFHSVGASDAVNVWRVAADGVRVRSEPSVRRTQGEPITLRRIVKDFGQIIASVSVLVGVPRQMIAALIAIESRGHADAENDEPQLKDISIGLTQTLTATAHELARRAPKEYGLSALGKLAPLPKGGDLSDWRFLLGNRRSPSASLGST